MHILYLRTAFHLHLKAGGSVGHTAGVIRGLAENGGVTVVSNAELPGVKEPVRYLRPWIAWNLPFGLSELVYSLQVILTFPQEYLAGIDAIYERHSQFGFAGAWLARKYRVPFLLEFNSSSVWTMQHWRDPQRSWKTPFRWLGRKLFTLRLARWNERRDLATADAIVVVSETLKESLVANGVPAEKILVNPNGVDMEKFHPGCGGAAIRDRYGFGEKTVVGFIGTFGQWHGVCELAEAIVRIYHEHPGAEGRVRFLLIGDGVLMPDVRRILAEGGVQEHVTLPGLVPQDDAPAWLDACDLYVSPHIPNADGTPFFGSPTKLFEYMAMGRGIVASRLGQIGAVLEDGRTARLVPPGDIPALADALWRLVTHPEEASVLGRAARAETEEHYTWTANVRRLLEFVRHR